MNRHLEKIVLASFFLSGAAALIYQVSWLRLAGLYFEGTAYAAATVVAIFMAGLALGSFLAGKLTRHQSRVQSPESQAASGGTETTSDEQRAASNNLLDLYFNLEALIAIVALLVPLLFTVSRPLFAVIYHAFYGQQSLYHLARILLSTLILLPTVTLMGMTLPLLIEALTREHGQLSRKSGFLYGINCAGAAAGATICGFLLLPNLGTFKTTLVGVAVNLIIAFIGWSTLGRWPFTGRKVARLQGCKEGDASNEQLATSNSADAPDKAATGRRGDGASKPDTDSSPVRRFAASPVRTYILPVFALSGFCSLNYEIIWTRILASNIGPASYSFATILCCFILGLALGSAVYAWLAPRIRDKVLSCGILLILAALAAIAVTLFLPRLPLLAANLLSTRKDDFLAVSLVKYLLAAIVILPLTIFSGALFPAAAASYARSASRLSESIGRLYAANSVGSIIGALLAGFVLLPLLSAQRAGLPIIALQLALGLYVIARKRGARITAYFLPLPLAAFILLLVLPGADPKVVFGGSYMYFRQYLKPKLKDLPRGNQDLLYYKDGPGGTVTVLKIQGRSKIFFAVNGKTDGSSEGSDMTTQTLSAHLPLLMHPRAEEVLIIGLGTGTTFATTLLHPIKKTTCLELSPQVVEAAKLFHPFYGGDPLRDHRAKIVIGDGRSYIFFNRENFDVIIAEPSNPWMSGVGNLFTREYFQAMRAKLKPGGIACQWLQGYRLSPDTFKTIINTFAAVFPHVSLWWVNLTEGDFLLLGSDAEYKFSLPFLDEKIEEYRIEKHFYIKRLMTPYTFLRCFVAADDDLRRFAASAEIVTDDNGLLEYVSPRELYVNALPELHAQLAALSTSPLVLLEQEDSRRPEVREKLAFYYKNRRDFINFLYQKGTTHKWGSPQLMDKDKQWRQDEDVSVALTHTLAEFVGRLYEESKKAASQQTANEMMRKALAGYRVSLSINPNQPDVYPNLAIIYRKLGDLEACKATVDDALARGFKRSELYEVSGEAYFSMAVKNQREGNNLKRTGTRSQVQEQFKRAHAHFLEAADSFRKAIEMNPSNPRYRINLGVTANNLGDKTTAREQFLKALELNPNVEKAAEYLAKIDGK